MPSYAKVLTETYLPAQASKFRWESAKTVAGAQFDALAELRSAIDDIRCGVNSTPTTSAPVKVEPTPCMFRHTGPGGCSQRPRRSRRRVARSDKLVAATERSKGAARWAQSSSSRVGRPQRGAVECIEGKPAPSNSSRCQASRTVQGLHGPDGDRPPNLKSKSSWKSDAQGGTPRPRPSLMRVVGSNQALIDLADNLGSAWLPRWAQGA
jgi:hypothetical protein